MLKNGFYTALGTPVDETGNFLPHSFVKHIEDQVNAGAAGLLVMGSMGIEPYIKDSEYQSIAITGAEAVHGRCPVFVGVMDNSISRVMAKIKMIDHLKIDGVVATVPFYYAVTQNEVLKFFSAIADHSPVPLYLYDLPGVTKTKINVQTAMRLAEHKNIQGIKTGDLITARILSRTVDQSDFHVLYSGLDTFDIAYQYGIRMNLDGMFSCTPALAEKLYISLESGDYLSAGKYLDDILLLRDTLVSVGVFSGFTCAMNLLGYAGYFSPDYSLNLTPEQVELIKSCLIKCGLL